MQQNENNKKCIEFIGNLDGNNTFYNGIAFFTTNQSIIKKLQSINYSYIKYKGQWKVTNDLDGSIKEAYIINFEEMPPKLLVSICETIDEKVNNENINEFEAVDFIIKLFSKITFHKETKEELLGNIGELIFILKCKEIGINADQNIRSVEESIYDFNFGSKYVEVKSTTKNMSEIVIDQRQLEESHERIFAVAKYQLLEKNTTDEKIYNICELYGLLNSSNPLIISKKLYYENLVASDDVATKLINESCINLQKVECFLIEENVLPKIQIVNKGGLKKIKCHVDVTNCKKIELIELKNINQL